MPDSQDTNFLLLCLDIIEYSQITNAQLPRSITAHGAADLLTWTKAIFHVPSARRRHRLGSLQHLPWGHQRTGPWAEPAALVSGSFAIYNSPHGRGFVLIHLPSQATIIDLDMQNACKHAAEKFAALDLNWWTCIPEEVIGPDLQEMRNIHELLKPTPWIASDWGREDR